MAKRRFTGDDVTVVVATLPERQQLLRRAFGSISGQTVKPWRVEVQLDTGRRGAWWARNQALTEVRTPLVACFDDDDEWDDNHLEVHLRQLNRRPEIDLLWSWPRWKDETGAAMRDPLACCRAGKLVAAPYTVPFGPQQRDHLDSRKSDYCPWCNYLRANFIPLGWTVRTELLRAVGGFPQPGTFGTRSSPEAEDYGALLLMLDAGGRFWNSQQITWTLNTHAGQTGGQGA